MSPSVPISKKLLFVNTAAGIVAKVTSVSVLVWLQRYLLKRISTEEYSLFPVVASLVVFLPLLSTLLTGGLGRFLVEAYAKGDERGVTQLVSTMSIVLVATGLLILGAGVPICWHVGRILTVAPERLWDAKVMLALLICSFVISLVLIPYLQGFVIRQKFILANLIDLSTELLRIALLFALLFGVSTRVLWVVVSTVSASFCQALVTVSISRRLVPALRFRWTEIRWGLVKSLTSFGGWYLVAQLAAMIRMNADPIILNKLATPMDVTCFYLGSMPSRQVQNLSSVAQRPLMPQLTGMYALRRKDLLRDVYLRGARYGLWAALLLSLPIMIYSRELISLWVGPDFLAAAVVATLLLAVYPFIYPNVMMSNIAIATAKVRSWSLRALTLQLINLLLTLYLVGVQGMGAIGCAISTFSVMALISPFVNIPFGLRLAGVRKSQWFHEAVWPGWLPGLVAAGIWTVLSIAVRPSTWVSLAICISCGSLSYIGILLAFGLRLEDRNDLRRLALRIQKSCPLHWRSLFGQALQDK